MQNRLLDLLTAIVCFFLLQTCNLERVGEGDLEAAFSVQAGLLYEDCPLLFTNSSSGASSFQWTFGDGETSTEENPKHTFATPGNYSVRLSAIKGTSSDDTLVPITVLARTVFSKNYFPGTSGNHGNSVIQDTDGGYILAGLKQNTGESELAYLAKTDANGTILWSKTFGTGNYQEFEFVSRLADGGLLVVGTTSGPFTVGEDVLLVKTDASGNKLWERNFGTASGNDDYGNAVVELDNGNIVVVGESGSDHLIIGCDPSGTKTWEKIINKNVFDILGSVLVTADNKLLVSGTTGSGNDNSLYLAKLEPTDGSILFEKTFGGNGYEEYGRLIRLSDGNYLLGGASNSNSSNTQVMLVKVDPAGNKLWEKYVGQNSWGISFTETSDGDIGVTGFSYSVCTAPCPDMYLAKTNASGILKWEKSLGGESGRNLQAVSDCGFIVVGFDDSFGIHLVKTDKDGNF